MKFAAPRVEVPKDGFISGELAELLRQQTVRDEFSKHHAAELEDAIEKAIAYKRAAQAWLQTKEKLAELSKRGEASDIYRIIDRECAARLQAPRDPTLVQLEQQRQKLMAELASPPLAKKSA